MHCTEKGIRFMAENKYAVPDGMLNAVRRAAKDRGSNCMCSREDLEEAVRWIAENPIIPSDKWIRDHNESAHKLLHPYELTARIIDEWQRRMFLAPEPKIGKHAYHLFDLMHGIEFNKQESEMLIEQVRINTRTGGSK